MRYVLPFPLLSAVLLATWLVLNQTLAPGHFVVGTALALFGGWTMRALVPPRGRPGRPGTILRLLGLVIADILRSNVAVARIVWGPRHRKITSGFLDIPLDLQSPYGLAALACIITATPGTLWVGYSRRHRTLTIHVLDLIDESEWIGTIKGRYERLLIEIFE